MVKTSVKERPILFRDEMTREILAGRKSQTRRVMKWKPYREGEELNYSFSGFSLGHYCTDVPSSGFVLYARRGGDGCWEQRTKPLRSPYGEAGDRLWVREAFLPLKGVGRLARTIDEATYVLFRDGSQKFRNGRYYQAKSTRDPATWPKGARWRPSIHMPRWASRILLDVLDVDGERLTKISEADAIAEGFESRDHFLESWIRHNGEGSVFANPWVFVIDFERLEGGAR